MQRLVLMIMLGMAINYGAIAQSLAGKVIDAQDQTPLVGAVVKVQNEELFAITANDGSFTIDNIRSETVTVAVSFVGFKPQVMEVTLPQSELQVALNSEIILEEVFIQALRAEEGSPIAQKTLEKRQIETEYWGQDAVMNLERLVPSVLAHSEAGTGFANYSLMRLRGIDQSRINFTLNGIPLNDMIDQGVFFSNFTDFSNNIQSVQVQRGVGTTTNGTASYAGSISYESTQINEVAPNVNLQLTTGSFGSFRGSVGLKSGLIKDRWAFGARFTKTFSDGYKFHSGTNSESFFFTGGYFGKNDLVKLTVLAGHTRNELAYLPVLIDDILVEPRTNYLDPNDEDDFQQQVVSLQHSHWFTNQWSLTTSIYYGGAGGDFPFGFDDGNGNLIQQNFPLYNDHYGLMTALSGTFQDGWKTDVGVHAYIFKRKNEEGFLSDKANPYYSDRSNKEEISAFAKIERQWGSWRIYGDLQLRRVTLDLQPDLVYLSGQGVNTNSLVVPLRDWTFLNPKLGITYDLNNQANAFMSFGRSGREPTRADILGSTVISSFNLNVVLDEDAVRAEYVNDLELGVNLAYTKFKAQANFFFMDFENEIAPTGAFIPEGFVQLRQNIADSYRTGLEIDWQWKPLESLLFKGQTTFMQSGIKSFAPGGTTEIFEDVEPILSPDWIINTSGNYTVNKYLTIGLSTRYVAESFLELTNQPDLILPDFLIANAQIRLNWKSHELAVHLNNLFNTQYFTNGAPVDVDFDGLTDGPGYLVQAPRSIYASLKLNF